MVDLAEEFARVSGEVPAVTLTYAQGSNTKSIATAWRSGAISRVAEGSGLDTGDTPFGIPADEFTTGFSGSNPVVPSPGDLVTVAGEDPWKVDSAELLGGSTYYQITCSKQSQRGTA